jgi:hypothetical protein
MSAALARSMKTWSSGEVLSSMFDGGENAPSWNEKGASPV